jgi:hypothetical protein
VVVCVVLWCSDRRSVQWFNGVAMVWVSGLMEAKLTGNQVMERIGGMAPSGFSASAHPNTVV